MANNPFDSGASVGGGGNPFDSGGGATATKKKGGGGLLHDIGRYSGAEFVGNLAKDIGVAGAGVVPGVVKVAAAVDKANPLNVHHLGKSDSNDLKALGTGIVKQYEDYYGHDLLHHLYTHPLQPILDVATVATGGLGAAAKTGKLAASLAPESRIAKLATLTDRGTVTTRSPRNIATGKGPVHTDITSTAPLSKLREQKVAALRAKRTTIGTKFPKLEPVAARGGEFKQYGKQIQADANLQALHRLAGFDAYQKATRRLSDTAWTALHIRAMDIHPDDLAVLWKGTNAEHIPIDPKIRELVLNPTPKLLRAEEATRSLSQQGEAISKSKGLLKDETAAARPDLTKTQATELLGRPVKTITGDPYYFPHTPGPQPHVSPLAAAGGGKGVPRTLGSTKQNLGVLALRGKLHLRSDVLGPEFLRRVKYVKYDEIHNALVRGAVRVTHQQIEQQWQGKLPAGYEFVRAKPGSRVVEKTVSAEPDPNQILIPGTAGATRITTKRVKYNQPPPASIRGEGSQHVPIEKLIPNPEDLHDSQLARDGFSTLDATQAHTSGGRYYIVPKATVKAATGEFSRSSDFTRNFVRRPLLLWRAAVLGLRVGFLTNNLVGNSLMYAVKTGGNGALRDLFAAIYESHGRETALKVLNSQATPPGLRADLYKEFFPEQVHGTFGRTQTPSTSSAHAAGNKAIEVGRAVTGAIPKLTSKVAEEAPRRALIRHYIRNSPEFKRVYSSLPKQTRTFEEAARKVLEGKGGAAYQRFISRKVNQALGDYLNLSPFERNVMRNTLPFYSWYRAISTTSYHLAVDTPLRANILGQIGQIGKQWTEEHLGDVPTFLEDAIGLGPGKNGTKKVLGTQGLDPYATFNQLERGLGGDYTSLGLNPFIEGPLQSIQRGKKSPGPILTAALTDIVRGLPPSRLIAPLPPSQLYPNRDRKSELFSNLGVPIKEYNPIVAARQKRQGR